MYIVRADGAGRQGAWGVRPIVSIPLDKCEILAEGSYPDGTETDFHIQPK